MDMPIRGVLRVNVIAGAEMVFWELFALQGNSFMLFVFVCTLYYSHVCAVEDPKLL